MKRSTASAVVPIHSPWNKILLEAIKQVQNKLFLISPYIKSEVISKVKETLLSRENVSTSLNVQVITRVLPEELLSGSSDIAALQQLLKWPTVLPESTVEIRAINNVHAKVWIFDAYLAFVGSGNATPSGLVSNLEYGLAVSNPQLVAQIWYDWQQWWNQATTVTEDQLEEMRLWLNKIKSNEDLRQIEIEADKKRKIVVQKIGDVPHIGKTFTNIVSGMTAFPPLVSVDTKSESDQYKDGHHSFITPQTLWDSHTKVDELSKHMDELAADSISATSSTTSIPKTDTPPIVFGDPPWEKIKDSSTPTEAVYQALWYHSSDISNYNGAISIGKPSLLEIGKVHEDVTTLPAVPLGTTGMSGQHLWQALLAIVPIADIIQCYENPKHTSPLHGLLTIENIRQERKQLLKCTWSDKNRTSQTTLQTQSNALQPSWAVALNAQETMTLMKRLNAALRDAWTSSSNIHLAFQDSPYQLALFYSLNPLLVRMGQNLKPLTIGCIAIPCQQADKVVTLLRLHSYLCLLTVKHKSLIDALKHLKKLGNLHGLSSPKVEIHIDTSENQSEYLITISCFEASFTFNEPIDQDASINTPIMICFDYSALEHITFYSTDDILSWQIIVDVNAKKVQFIPAVWKSGEPLSKFQHELMIE